MADAACLLALRIQNHKELIAMLAACTGKTQTYEIIEIEKNVLNTETEIKVLADYILTAPHQESIPLGFIADDAIPGFSQSYQDKLFGMFKLAKQSTFTDFCKILTENNISINI